MCTFLIHNGMAVVKVSGWPGNGLTTSIKISLTLVYGLLVCVLINDASLYAYMYQYQYEETI